jgi:hypothetical protein
MSDKLDQSRTCQGATSALDASHADAAEGAGCG